MAFLYTLALATLALTPYETWAASSVERNSNVVGQTLPGYYRGIPGMQDNEPSCALNPLLARNIVCAWNASGGSDDPVGPGDTAIRMSESIDGGVTFFNRYINGTSLNPATSLNVQFTADPVTMCWPGGCGILHIGADRGEFGGTGGGIYMQRAVDSNTEFGFRKRLETMPLQVYRTTGSKFADKVHGTYILDVNDPGSIDVTLDIENPDGTTETVVRQWPKARIIVTFALFNPSKNDIEILSTYSDCYGCSWSPPKQVAVTSGRDQGVSVTAMGDTVLYTFRVFESDQDPSAMRGVISPDGGKSLGKPFDIVSPLCAYDVPTFPSATETTIAASRTNDFPSASHNGEYFIMLYSERKLNSDGTCFTNFNEPTDSRIKAIVGSADGTMWSNPVEIAPNPGHGFQFMPAIDCSLGVCQGGWWDSRFDTLRTTNYLQNVSTNPKRLQALEAFLNFPVLGDFNYRVSGNSVIQFRRTARVMTTRIEIRDGEPVAVDDPPAVVSQYRRALVNGAVTEMQGDAWNVKAYRDSSSPFMGDYSGMTSVKQRLVFDPEVPASEPFWEDNSSFDIRNPDKEPLFWMSFVSSRNVSGDIFTARMPDQVPFARTPYSSTAAIVAPDNATATNPDAGSENPMAALSVEDFNPGAGFCTPVENPGTAIAFDALNNRTKDFDIYGALIENKTNAWSLNPTKTLNTQRSYVFVAENAGDEETTFRFVIANRPAGFPDTARASWDQLPTSPADPGFSTTPPNEVESILVQPRSSEALPLFVYSETDPNPVAIDIYEQVSGGPETLINTITVNGAVEAGNFLNLDGTINTAEFHNPKVFTPDEFNPDEFNPDEYNPDEFNPGLYTPDEFNPDEFNPDEFNPDEFNPDEFNPDEFNPDEFNPDEFNPDEFNPDEFNSPLTDPATIHNPEIPGPELRDIEGLVVKLDINYGVQNIGNTITPYTVDFAINDPEILALLENGDLVTQLIAWQDKKIDDVQFCAPRIISENRVLSAVNNPDLSELLIPDIIENRLGILTFVIAPYDVVQTTLRFIAPYGLMQEIAPKLTANNISYMFASQVANTGSTSLFVNEELIVSPQFNFLAGETTTFEATGPDGAPIPSNLVRAFVGPEELDVTCAPALGSTVGLDIDNDPAGPTPMQCEARQGTDIVRTLDMFISVLDRTAPTIDLTTIPDDDPTAGGFKVVLNATSPAGAEFTFETPSATDAAGVDPDVEVSCTPSSGTVFPFNSPEPTTTTVTCVATDDSLNTDTASFDVTVQDISAPVFDDFDPPDLTPPLAKFVLADNASSFRIFWGPFTVSDADASPVVSCNVGELYNFDPTTGQYTFVHDFGVGETVVICTATDNAGLVATGTFSVTVFDETGPTISLNGDPTITVLQGSGPYVDPGATAVDVVDGDVSGSIIIDDSAVNTDVAGEYTVSITARDNAVPVPNETTVFRTVIVEFQYAGSTGIQPQKLLINRGSSDPLFWAWLDQHGNPVDSSDDMQMLHIENCKTGQTVLSIAGDPGSSGFRFKSDLFWQFNWEAIVKPGSYCAVVESSRSGQEQFSPPITVK
jgi:hypothetical protein